MTFSALLISLFLKVPVTLINPAPSPNSLMSSWEESAVCLGCDYVVPAGQSVIDGRKLNLKPGSVICLKATTKYRELTFSHIRGTAAKPILIRNCGGRVMIKAPGNPFIVKFADSRHFRFTGGKSGSGYGIRLSESKTNGLVLGPFVTDFRVDHIEISDVGFAGIMAKTDPTCDEASHRGNFTMRNVQFDHNYVHDTGGEGFYIGHTAFTGAKTPCGEFLPHTIENIRVTENLVRNSGWDGIQLSCATVGASIHGNTVENYSVLQKRNQSGGITIGTGTSGVCHSNIINTGYGAGIVVFGLADNYIYNNIIVNPDGPGVFCDERADVGRGYFFFHNTIINPSLEGFKMYSEIAPTTVIVNNIIVNSQAVDHKGKNTPITSLKTVRLDTGSNYATADISRLGFVDPSRLNFRIAGSSPAVDNGRDIASYLPDGQGIPLDFYGTVRRENDHYDIGAAEYQPSGIMHWFRKLFFASE